MKIKATYLRVGNLVNDEDGEPMYIAGIWPTQGGDRFIDSAGNTGKVTILSGIELSSDILLKAGFEPPILRPETDTDYSVSYDLEGVDFNDIEAVYLKDGTYYIGLYNGEYFVTYENAGYDEEAHLYTIGKGFKYLHDLQNIFFWLNGGTELHINI